MTYAYVTISSCMFLLAGILLIAFGFKFYADTDSASVRAEARIVMLCGFVALIWAMVGGAALEGIR